MFTGKAIGGEWGFFIATIIVFRLIAGRHQARRFIVTGFIVRVIVCVTRSGISSSLSPSRKESNRGRAVERLRSRGVGSAAPVYLRHGHCVQAQSVFWRQNLLESSPGRITSSVVNKGKNQLVPRVNGVFYRLAGQTLEQGLFLQAVSLGGKRRKLRGLLERLTMSFPGRFLALRPIGQNLRPFQASCVSPEGESSLRFLSALGGGWRVVTPHIKRISIRLIDGSQIPFGGRRVL